MARTIPEQIAGIELFVPSQYDFFDILPTGMPNGDPCLVVKAGDARAFAPAPTMTPNVFKKAGQGPYAVSFWTKTTTIENAKNWRFGVETVNAAGLMSLNSPWGVEISTHISGLNQVTFYHQGTAQQNFALSPAANTNWQFFVMNIPAPGVAATSYKNTDVALTTQAAVTAGTPDYNANQFFYIGRYGDSSAASSVTSDKYIGKICIHNRLLTLTECQLMYLEMTT